MARKKQRRKYQYAKQRAEQARDLNPKSWQGWLTNQMAGQAPDSDPPPRLSPRLPPRFVKMQETGQVNASVVQRGATIIDGLPSSLEGGGEKPDPQSGLGRPPELGKEYVEGERRERLSQYFERDPKLRTAAIALHGTTCMVCGFDFGATYGVHGAGYVEVHHLRPVSSLQAKTKVNPQTDMVVLCANCHRMIHRHKDKLLRPDELKSLLMR